jgi:hypothetical protein
MAKSIRKLVLHKETVRMLTAPELARVHGGFETAYEDEQTVCHPGTNTCPGGGCQGTGGACGPYSANGGHTCSPCTYGCSNSPC